MDKMGVGVGKVQGYWGYIDPVWARKIREWNSLDTALYDHFEKKLDMAVEKYGRNRMNVEVSKLRSQLREVEEKCVDVSFKIRLQSGRSDVPKMVVLLKHLLWHPKMADQFWL